MIARAIVPGSEVAPTLTGALRAIVQHVLTQKG